MEVEDESEDDDDDEMSALLMVDGAKNKPPPSVRASTASRARRSSSADLAWTEWMQIDVPWDSHADEGADLYVKGQYSLLKLYRHVDILTWFRDVGQQAYPAEALLARTYLGQQQPSLPELGPFLLRESQEGADWDSDTERRAEQRCILRHNWQQRKHLHVEVSL